MGIFSDEAEVRQPDDPMIMQTDSLLYVWMYGSFFLPNWKTEKELKELCDKIHSYKELIYHFQRNFQKNDERMNKELKNQLITIQLHLDAINAEAEKNKELVKKHELRKGALFDVLKEAIQTAKDMN